VVCAITLIGLTTADIVIAFLELYQPLTNPDIIGVPGAWDLFLSKPHTLYLWHVGLYLAVAYFQDAILVRGSINRYTEFLLSSFSSGGCLSCGIVTGLS
jgi:hypothetical protein